MIRCDDDDDDCCCWQDKVALSIFAFIIFGGLLTVLVICGLFIARHDEIDGFSNRLCDRANITSNIHPNGGCHWGELHTRIFVQEFNATVPVRLTFPEINKWIQCKDEKDVEGWIAGMTGSGSFSCLIDIHPDGDTFSIDSSYDGVKENYSKIWLAWLGMVASSLALVVCIVGSFCKLMNDCCG